MRKRTNKRTALHLCMCPLTWKKSSGCVRFTTITVTHSLLLVLISPCPCIFHHFAKLVSLRTEMKAASSRTTMLAEHPRKPVRHTRYAYQQKTGVSKHGGPPLHALERERCCSCKCLRGNTELRFINLNHLFYELAIASVYLHTPCRSPMSSKRQRGGAYSAAETHISHNVHPFLRLRRRRHLVLHKPILSSHASLQTKWSMSHPS